MTLAELVKLGSGALVDMALSGTIRPRHVWTAFKGAERYRRAMADGDVAVITHAEARVAKCGECPRRTDHPKEGGSVAHYCGNPFEELDEGPCGCLVGVTVDGAMLPAAKTLVASETCPLDPPQWLAGPRGLLVE